MWWNLLVLPFAAIIIADYADAWSTEQVAIAIAIGGAIAIGNHVNLMFSQTIPDPIGWQHTRFSAVIVMHGVYMTVYGALAVLFVLYSGPVPATTAALVASIFLIDLVCGMHVPLGIVDQFLNLPLVPKTFLRKNVFFALGVIGGLLAACALVATK